MGDANASIPTPQPVLYRPMFGTLWLATAADQPDLSSRRRQLEAGLPAQLGLRKTPAAVQGCRTIGKTDMVHNDATPHHRGGPGDLRGARRR